MVLEGVLRIGVLECFYCFQVKNEKKQTKVQNKYETNNHTRKISYVNILTIVKQKLHRATHNLYT